LRQEELISKACLKKDIHLTKENLLNMLKFVDFLSKKNKQLNLIGTTSINQIIINHLIDALMLTKFINLIETDYQLIDIGSGNGFPAIVIKLYYPKIKVCLVEANHKKSQFLKEVIDFLNLEGIEVICDRAENLNSFYKERFNLGTCRGVGKLVTICEYVLPYLKLGGIFLAQKGFDISWEIKTAEYAINILGGRLKSIEFYTLPYTNTKRSLVIIEKQSKTPDKFPRRIGLPKKRPLIA
jgi:16S rRNA (guanine527-N7)-methyltransferase